MRNLCICLPFYVYSYSLNTYLWDQPCVREVYDTEMVRVGP